jgi:hypothetical protein
MYQLPAHDRARLSDLCDKLFPPQLLCVEQGGIERAGHVTVAFGFDPQPDVEADLAEVLAACKPLTMELGKLGKFDLNGHVCIHADVISPDFEDLHYRLRGYFGDRLKVTFPDYHPHMTLAYLKPGAEADAFVGDLRLAGEAYLARELIYSVDRDGVRARRIFVLGRQQVSESVGKFLR